MQTEIDIESGNYPDNLKVITDPPQKIFVSGSLLPSDKLAVAIVGSREASNHGMEVASHFSFFLAKSGLTIVSGLARGIDSVAHSEALRAKGRTIAVLGSSLDNIYPPENKSLAEKISKSGAVISEFPNTTKPLPQNFLQRNRIIAGLSLAIVVIEGKKRSGTLSTANWAGNYGREVFAVPGPVNSPLSEAPNFLLENGAHQANSPQVVLDYISELFDI